MQKLILGIIIGLVLGILGTLLTQRAWRGRPDSVAQQSLQLFQVAPSVVERALPGSKVLDVDIQTPSTHTVNYEHEALYDVHITYDRKGEIRAIILPFGFAGNAIISPRTTDVVIADDKAKIIHRRRSSDQPSQ